VQNLVASGDISGDFDLERAAAMWVRMFRTGELGAGLTLDDL
jgi:hypothetical protein